MGSSKTKKMAARMPRRIALEQRKYAAGMVDTLGWQFETFWTSLHNNWNLYKVRKKTYVFTVFMRLL